MSTLTWERCDGYEYARAGLLEFFVIETDDGASLCRDGEAVFPENGTGYDSIDLAKAAAEETARAEYDALAKHFAPMLRWVDIGDASVAELGAWVLRASDRAWSVRIAHSGTLRSGDDFDTREECVRAAESALRKFGVVFRTEGEP